MPSMIARETIQISASNEPIFDSLYKYLTTLLNLIFILQMKVTWSIILLVIRNSNISLFKYESLDIVEAFWNKAFQFVHFFLQLHQGCTFELIPGLTLHSICRKVNYLFIVKFTIMNFFLWGYLKNYIFEEMKWKVE